MVVIPIPSGGPLTFLNSYKSVALLNSHMPLIPVGSSQGSVGCQYSRKPPSSAEMTVSYRSLYCESREQKKKDDRDAVTQKP